MAEKKYYWLKLPKDWFLSKQIKRLRKLAGGDTYTIIYLKMMLKSLSDGGKLYFDKLDDTFADELALDLDESPDDVTLTLQFLVKCGLIVMTSEDEYQLPEALELTGKETGSAKRMRLHREQKKVSHCDADVTPLLQTSDTEKEIEKETEIETEIETEKERSKPRRHRYGEYNHVLLSDKERDKLFEEFGERKTLRAITFLDEYMEEKGKKYSNCNLAMRRWVFDAIDERDAKESKSGQIDWSKV